MKSALWVLAIAIAVGGAEYQAASAATVQEEPSEAPQLNEVQALARQFDEHLRAREFDQALHVAGQLEPYVDNDGGRAVVATMRASALLGLGRDEEARKQIADAERLAPNDPTPSRALFFAGLLTDRNDVAAEALDRLIGRFPDVVRELEPDLVSHFLRNEPEGQKTRNEDRRVALARLGYGGRVQGDYLTSEAIDILLERGDVAGASDLVRYVDEPRLVEDMLIQKRYAPLWPQIESMAGPRLEKVRDSSVAEARRAYTNEPDSENLQLLANALRYGGGHSEAIALRSKLPADGQAMVSADEHLGWAVNNVAMAMHEAGRAEEADQLLAMLNEAPMAEGRGRWRVSMIINRVSLLLSDGKFERALPLLDLTEASARNDGSPYAQQLVRGYRYCNYGYLGRHDEAAKVLPEMLAHAKDAYGAAVEALICAGDLDKAEQVALEALKSEETNDFESRFARALQPRLLTGDEYPAWESRLVEFRQRPAIAREYERIARDMPEAFLVVAPHAPKKSTD